jgi:two-component system phosphate regulon response regulator PhoB
MSWACTGASVSDMPRILLVDDEAEFAVALHYRLETDGFLVEHVADGQEALNRIEKIQPAVVLLDWTLPVISGIEVCRRLRSRSETKNLRVIMVTSRTGDWNAIHALNAGADDYVVKPFALAELMARIRALLRRTAPIPERKWLHLRGIAMDLAGFRVTCNGRNMHLGPTEFRLLKLLMEHPKRLFSRRELIDVIWGAPSHVNPRNVDVHVRRLRRSIAREGEPDLIRTVRGIGYAFNIE